MMPPAHNLKIIAGLLVLLACLAGWGYWHGDWQQFAPKPQTAETAEQTALDHLFGSDRAFDPNAEDVTTLAAGKNDTTSWRTLAHAKAKGDLSTSLSVAYGQDVLALDGKQIKISGFMFPLQGAEKQSHFLLSAYPPSCPYCLPGGPSELIEVTGNDPIPFTYDQITLQGTFHPMRKPEELQDGVFYKMTDVTKE